MKWPYSLGLQPWHMHTQSINFLQTPSVLLILSFVLRNGSYPWHISTGKKLWLLIVWPPRLNNYTSNNWCFSFKENVFSPQRPLYQLHMLHRPRTSQSESPGYKPQLCYTHWHSLQGIWPWIHFTRGKKGQFLPHNNSKESESFPGCGPRLWLLKSSLGGSDSTKSGSHY